MAGDHPQLHRVRVGVFDSLTHGYKSKLKCYIPLDYRLSLISLRLALAYKLMNQLMFQNCLHKGPKFTNLHIKDNIINCSLNTTRLSLALSLLILLAGDVHTNPGPPPSPTSQFKIASLNTRSIKRVDYTKDKLNLKLCVTY